MAKAYQIIERNGLLPVYNKAIAVWIDDTDDGAVLHLGPNAETKLTTEELDYMAAVFRAAAKRANNTRRR